VKRIILSLAALALLSGQGGNARAGSVYVVSSSRQFGIVDLQTGVFTSRGTADWNPEDMTGLPGGTIYAMDPNNVLLTVNPANGHGTVVGTTGLDIDGIKFRQDGTLFGLSGPGNLYTIDKSTGAPTFVGSTGINFSFYDLAFDSSNQLFAVNTDAGFGLSNLYSIDPTTHLAHLVGPVGFRLSALEFQDGTLYGFTDSAPREIISIDRTTGVGTVAAAQDLSLDSVFGAAPAEVSAVVPEPAGLTLLGIGFVGLMGYLLATAWRRRAGFLIVSV
jgi:hypothetical protein